MSAKPQLEIRMQPGKQEQAAACTADIMIYGGSAGAGKSYWLVCEPLKWVGIPGFTCVYFRREAPMLTGSGSAFEEAKELYSMFGGRMREGADKDARFRTGKGRDSLIEFTHLQQEKHLKTHQSKQYALIIFDELTQFTERQFWYMVSRSRSTCGVKPYIRCATNPDPDSWVRRLVSWWLGEDGYPIEKRSGVIRWFIRHEDDLVWFDTKGEALFFVGKNFKHMPKAKQPRPKSFTFIAASLDDNPKLEELDPNYRSNLLALPKVERMQLLGGNWKIKRGAGDFFQRAWVNMIPIPPEDLVEIWRGWDKAATEATADNPSPDYTANVLLGRRRNGRIVVLHADRFQFSPGKVQTRMRNRAVSDGRKVKIALWQDPGGAGKSDVYNDKMNLIGYVVNSEPAREKKGIYFLPFSSACENGLVDVVEAPWNDEYFYELENFMGDDKKPTKKEQDDGVEYHDDWVDATSGAFLRLNTSALGVFKALAQWRNPSRIQA